MLKNEELMEVVDVDRESPMVWGWSSEDSDLLILHFDCHSDNATLSSTDVKLVWPKETDKTLN